MVSPVGFSSSVIPAHWRLLYSLNPMVSVIDGFRWCILRGQTELYGPGMIVGVAVVVFFLWFGVRQFRKTEEEFRRSNLKATNEHPCQKTRSSLKICPSGI